MESSSVLSFIFRVKSNAVKELREGDSYGSSVELMIHQDINEIPSPRVPPKDVGIKSASIPVYFDLETTGLGKWYTNVDLRLRATLIMLVTNERSITD